MRFLIVLLVVVTTLVIMAFLPEPCKVSKGGLFISPEFKFGLLHSLVDYFFVAFPLLVIFVYQVTQSIYNKAVTPFGAIVFLAVVVAAMVYYKQAHNRVVEAISKGDAGEKGMNCRFNIVDLASTDISQSKKSGVFVRELSVAGARSSVDSIESVSAWIEKRTGRNFRWLLQRNDYPLEDEYMLCVEIKAVAEGRVIADLVIDGVGHAFFSTSKRVGSVNRVLYVGVPNEVTIAQLTSLEQLYSDQSTLSVTLH